MREHLADEAATEALGRRLAARTPSGGTWLLAGGLGVGKTTWCRGFVEGLGGDPDQVASPTYAVITSSKDQKEDDETVSALEEAGAQVYLTRKGVVTAVTDGSTLSVSQE